MSERYQYRVLSKRSETRSTSTLTLQRIDGSIPTFRAGQYITVYFPDINPTLGKEYTISNAPREKEFGITVKAIGRYSRRLCSLEPGDTFLASGAQGDFYPHDPRRACLIAGGMGVTPLRGIAVEAMGEEGCDIDLLYSSRYSFEMPFGEELYSLSRGSPSFRMERFVTRDLAIPPGARSRRMRSEDIFTRVDKGTLREFLVSGSVEFVRTTKDMLLSCGVTPERIFTEACS